MSARLERRLARCERRSGRGQGPVGPCFYLLRPGDPDPVLPANAPPFVFVMDLRGKPSAAAGPKDRVPPMSPA
jgi:hypothetical protein